MPLRDTPAKVTLVDTDTFTARIVTIPGHTSTGHHWLSANGKYSFVGVENPAGIAPVMVQHHGVVPQQHGLLHIERGFRGQHAGRQVPRDAGQPARPLPTR